MKSVVEEGGGDPLSIFFSILNSVRVMKSHDRVRAAL